MSYAPYLSDERLTATRIIPWAGEGKGKSAVSQATGLLTAGESGRKGTCLKEVVVGWPRQWEGERGWGRGGGGDQVGTWLNSTQVHLSPHFCNEVDQS
jgi:hypothetical protein